MKLLYQQLTDHLLGYLPKNYQANLYSWLHKGKILNNGRDITDNQVTGNGIEICQIEYEAMLWFEALPFKEIDPLKILTLINVWTAENDHDYLELNHELDFEIEPIDDLTVDLTLTVKFRERITGVADEKGDILKDGMAFRLSDVIYPSFYRLSDKAKLKAKFIK